MSGAVVDRISVTVHRFVKQLLVSNDRSVVMTTANECILIIDWFSSKVKDLPGSLCDVCYEGDLEGLH